MDYDGKGTAKKGTVAGLLIRSSCTDTGEPIVTCSTGTRAINFIPSVVAAPPGLLSAMDLPLARQLPQVSR